MDGPTILAASLTHFAREDRFGNPWQYHSQSDRHSKVACWAILFDLLQHCPLLLEHAKEHKIAFGINHQMHDFKTNRQKDLDLVICTPGSEDARSAVTFSSYATSLLLSLTPSQQKALAKLPTLVQRPVGSVHLAMEAKACMTEHGKALPRLYDELNSSHLAIHGSADFAIAVGFVMINFADTFVSPNRNKHPIVSTPVEITRHKQPSAAQRTIQKVLQIPRRTQLGNEGFDALGIVGIDMKNDGSVTKLVRDPLIENYSYESMINRASSLYASKFGNV